MVKKDLDAVGGFTTKKINDEVGFGLVTTKKLTRGRTICDGTIVGECILMCYPYSCSPLYEAGSFICSYCFQMGKTSSCSSCHVAKYCCRDCQSCDWYTLLSCFIYRKYHKLLCQEYRCMGRDSSSIKGLQSHQGEYTLLLKTFEVFINGRKGAYSTKYNSSSMKMDKDAIREYSPSMLYFMNEFTNRNTEISCRSLVSFYDSYKDADIRCIHNA